MTRQLLVWQYTDDPNEVNEAILKGNNPNWEGLKSADQIVNITYDTEQKEFVVFWTLPEDHESWDWSTE